MTGRAVWLVSGAGMGWGATAGAAAAAGAGGRVAAQAEITLKAATLSKVAA